MGGFLVEVSDCLFCEDSLGIENLVILVYFNTEITQKLSLSHQVGDAPAVVLLVLIEHDLLINNNLLSNLS